MLIKDLEIKGALYMEKKKAIVVFTYPEFGNHIHNFLVDEIELMKKIFSEVHLICGETKLPFESNVFSNNVIVHMFKKNEVLLNLLSFPFHIGDKVIQDDLKNSKKLKLYGLSYLFHSAKFWAYSEAIYKIIEGIINHDDCAWFVESYWLDCGALAVAKAKDKFSNIITATRAHSVEIDPIKNKYCQLEFKEYIDKKIGKIVFISKNGLEFYTSNISVHFDSPEAKTKYIRLGSKKVFEGMNSGSQDDVFRILSCSRVEKVKRVDLIIDAMSHLRSKRVDWAHIGVGSQMQVIESKLMELSNNENVKVNFLGDFIPYEVQKYLLEHPVDLFVNVSSSEGVPVSIMEAQSYSIPVLATDVGGVKEIVNLECGFLIDSNITPEELAQKLDSIIEDNRVNLTKKIANREKIYLNWTKFYDINKCFVDYLDFCFEK